MILINSHISKVWRGGESHNLIKKCFRKQHFGKRDLTPTWTHVSPKISPALCSFITTKTNLQLTFDTNFEGPEKPQRRRCTYTWHNVMRIGSDPALSALVGGSRGAARSHWLRGPPFKPNSIAVVLEMWRQRLFPAGWRGRSCPSQTEEKLMGHRKLLRSTWHNRHDCRLAVLSVAFSQCGRHLECVVRQHLRRL